MEYLWLLPVLFPAVGFFWGNCPCCGTLCYVECPGPPDVPQSFSITISGITNGTCDECDGLNGTHVLDFHDPAIGANNCDWRAPVSTLCITNGSLFLYRVYCAGCEDVDNPVESNTCRNRLHSTINLGGFNYGPYQTAFSGYGNVVLPKVTVDSAQCQNWPSSITVEVQP